MYSDETFIHPYSKIRVSSRRINLGALQDKSGNLITTDQIVDKLVEYLGDFKIDIGITSFSFFDTIPDRLREILIPILVGKLKEKINEKIKSALDMKKEIEPGDKTISKAIANTIYDLFSSEFKDHVLNLYPKMSDVVDNTRIGFSGLYAQDESIGYFDFLNADPEELICALVLSLISDSGILYGKGKEYVVNNLTGIIWKGFEWILENIFGIDLEKEKRDKLTGEVGITELIEAWKSAGGATSKALDFIEHLRSTGQLAIGLKFDDAMKIKWLQDIENWWVIPYQAATQGNEFLYSLTYPYLDAIKEAFIVEISKVAIPISKISIEIDKSIAEKILEARKPKTVTFTKDQVKSTNKNSSIPVVPVAIGGIGLLVLAKYLKWF